MRVTVVRSVDRCRSVVREILSSSLEPLVGVDYRGVDMNKSQGHLSVLTIAAASGQCFLFDMKKQPLEMMTEGELCRILITNDLTKVIHDCSDLSTVLWNQFRLQLSAVYDTQMAYFSVLSDLRLPVRYLSLEQMCLKLGSRSLYTTPKLQRLLTQDKNAWDRRPLTDHMMQFCCERAFLLQTDARDMIDSINDSVCADDTFSSLCREQRLSGKRPGLVRQKQRERQRRLQHDVADPRGTAPKLELTPLERALLDKTHHLGIV